MQNFINISQLISGFKSLLNCKRMCQRNIKVMFRNLIAISVASIGLMICCITATEILDDKVENPCKQLQAWNEISTRPLFWVEDNKGGRFCCKCPRGTKVHTMCYNKTHPDSTKCVVCEHGTFMEMEMHTNTECFLLDNIDCSDHDFKVVIYGDPKNRPSCHCQSGYFLSKSSCIPFQPCKVNHEVEMQGTPFTDRTCRPCLRGYESKGGTDICVPRLNKSVTVGQTTTPSSQYGMFSTVPIVKLQSDCPSCVCNCPASPCLVYIILLILLLIAAVGFIAYKCWLKKRGSSESRQENPLLLKFGTSS